MLDLGGLPGESLIRTGVADLRGGRLTVEALTLAVANERLRSLGIEISCPVPLPDERELALYEELQRSAVDDPFARYSSLIRELDSFLEAAEGRRRRAA